MQRQTKIYTRKVGDGQVIGREEGEVNIVAMIGKNWVLSMFVANPLA
jgi:hypothetical protein